MAWSSDIARLASSFAFNEAVLEERIRPPQCRAEVQPRANQAHRAFEVPLVGRQHAGPDQGRVVPCRRWPAVSS
jgi:hypothetical protein